MAPIVTPYRTLVLPKNWKTGEPIPTYEWDWHPSHSKLMYPSHHTGIIDGWIIDILIIQNNMGLMPWKPGPDRDIYADEYHRWEMVYKSLLALRNEIDHQDDYDTDDDEDMGKQFRPLGCLHMHIKNCREN